MTSKLTVVYVRGGDQTAPSAALMSGMRYGIRHDYKEYSNDVYMIDVNPDPTIAVNWKKYLEKVDRLRPVAASVQDFAPADDKLNGAAFDAGEHGYLLDRTLKQIDDLRGLGVPRILVCPKFRDGIPLLPQHVDIAVSVPSPTYAGYIPPLEQLRGRRVHLLGGRPDSTKKRVGQDRLIVLIDGIGGDVVSTDLNYQAGVAIKYGRYFHFGRWVEARKMNLSNFDLIVKSNRSIVQYLNHIKGLSQPRLT